MTVIGILLTSAIAGFVVWIILQISMPVVVKNIILGVVAIVLVLWVLQVFGIHTGFPVLRLN